LGSIQTFSGGIFSGGGGGRRRDIAILFSIAENLINMSLRMT
jgi:hypothetical protein